MYIIYINNYIYIHVDRMITVEHWSATSVVALQRNNPL